MDENKKSGLSTAGLVLGIVGICLSFIPLLNVISFILSILAIVFGIIGIVKKAGKGKAIAALILGIVTLLIAYNINKATSEGLNKLTEEINNEPNTSTVSNNNSNTAEPNEEEKKEYNVGEEYNGSGMKISYVAVNPDFKEYSRYATVKDGYKIVSATFEFENVSDSDKLASSLDFSCYADGYDCEKFYSVDDASFSSTLSAGKKAKGNIYFEVPQNATDVVIEYETSVWTSNKVTFRVI